MSDKSSHHLQKQFLGRGCVDEPSLQKNNPPNPRTPIFNVENSCLHWCELLSCRRPGGKCKPSLATLNLGVRGCAAPVINSWGHCEKWCELLSHYSTPGGSQSAPPKRTDRQRACPWSPSVEPRVQKLNRGVSIGCIKASGRTRGPARARAGAPCGTQVNNACNQNLSSPEPSRTPWVNSLGRPCAQPKPCAQLHFLLAGV